MVREGKVVGSIIAAQQAGEVRRDIDADYLARHLVALTEGGIMLSRLQKSDHSLSYNFV